MSSAFRAIVSARLREQVRLVLSCCVAAALVAFIAPHRIDVTRDPLAADLATRSVWLAGPMFFCGFLGIFIALAQRGGGRMRALELAEQSAPLYGRQLARATAVPPCVAATLSTLVYWGAQFLSGFAAPPTFFVLALAAVLAATLVALSATLRTGVARWLYVALAGAVVAIAYVLAVYADTFGPVPRALGHYPDVIGVSAELAFCILVGFLALRQYGETLARYDPIP